MSAKASMRSRAEALATKFEQVYGGRPAIFRAPGRVNLIGEHTDYNDGFVMPAAIVMSTLAAVAPRNDGKLKVRSAQFEDEAEFSLDALNGGPRRHWSDYVRGVAGVMQASGHRLHAASLMVDSNVPLGSGLSSSAALEVSSALAIAAVSGITLDALSVPKICQRAEHEYAGTHCGIMDQFIAAFGQADHALMLDCRSLAYELLPLDPSVRLVICNTMVKHELAGGEYNKRRMDCEAGVKALQKHLPNITALRDVTSEELERYKTELPERVYRRCRHVVTEDERVMRSAAALKSGDLTRFGELMYASHNSLRDDYEVTCDELVLMVNLASAIEGVYGARMTGGGFGGCTVNLVKAEAAERFQNTIAQQYEAKTGRKPMIYLCSAADGAGPVEL
jgi:galactokinase